MVVVVNGSEKEIGEPETISQFVSGLGLNQERLAVEVNGMIVRRTDWATTLLGEGDKIEVVHFVGGGNC